jgi:hypothetical protein
LGTTTVDCSASDSRHNVATGSFTVAVMDTTPPVLTLPANITAEATGPAGATVTYTTGATDLVDGAVPVTCVPISGSTFPLGTTTVTCSASDTRHNTSTGTFTVTIVDTTPPVLTLPANITKEATGPSGAAVAYTTSATDIVDGSRPVTCSPISGSTFALGTATVTCSASDTRHNTSTGTFTVTVVDTTPPVLTLPANITTVGSSGVAVSFTVSAIDLVDGSRLVTCTPPSGSTFAAGHVTTVTCTASDTRHNTATGTFTVTVVAPTSMLYNGQQIVTLDTTTSFTPGAGLTSPVTTCQSGQPVAFSLDVNPITGLVGDYNGGTDAGTYLLETASSITSGQASGADLSITGWSEGVYTIYATYAGTAVCASSFDTATVTVAKPGDAATGGGWYTSSGSGRVNFGFVVHLVPNTTNQYTGQFLLINNGKWRLKGTLNSYVKTSTQGAASGTSNLYWWDTTLNGGLGDWHLAQSGVAYTISFSASGANTKSSPGSMGIQISYTPVSPQPATLPNSSPTSLKGGHIQVS